MTIQAGTAAVAAIQNEPLHWSQNPNANPSCIPRSAIQATADPSCRLQAAGSALTYAASAYFPVVCDGTPLSTVASTCVLLLLEKLNFFTKNAMLY
jgi:hypothetical protein